MRKVLVLFPTKVITIVLFPQTSWHFGVKQKFFMQTFYYIKQNILVCFQFYICKNLLIPGYIMEYYPTIEKNETAICNDVNRLKEYFS